MKIEISFAVAVLTGMVWQEYRISNLHQTVSDQNQKIDQLNHTSRMIENTQSMSQESIELETSIRRDAVQRLETKF